MLKMILFFKILSIMFSGVLIFAGFIGAIIKSESRSNRIVAFIICILAIVNMFVILN